jgi:hypothetical protein
MVRNQGDARKLLLAVARANHGDARTLPVAWVIAVRHFHWFEYGPDESFPLLSTPYQPDLIARISDWCSLM